MLLFSLVSSCFLSFLQPSLIAPNLYAPNRVDIFGCNNCRLTAFTRTSFMLPWLAHVEKALLLRFYTSCIRSVCDYAIPVLHTSLPQYLIDDLERVQKRALSIICPTLSYDNAPASLDLELLVVHHHRLCQSLFNSILEDTDHRLRHLLPVSYSPKYSLRHPRAFDVKFKTYRARNCFINSQCLRVNSLGQPSDF